MLHKEAEKVLLEMQNLLFLTCFFVLCVCLLHFRIPHKESNWKKKEIFKK